MLAQAVLRLTTAAAAAHPRDGHVHTHTTSPDDNGGAPGTGTLAPPDEIGGGPGGGV
ncbi:hypothetical protein MMF93_32995 [Streptomyces tubbatahanensis]|uniref:Uncharacterized protein n=1 Tax=Streptomyces tubbatahanensis TaxID=2923272 RepID=A0ABY3Y2E7_9ACTN|nr:hypothetical protein [Streptomyces tubbatahanensis]UNT00767.1 hypothetical protein MMF93_32995 [Streptomyces tubbatahanensis]